MDTTGKLSHLKKVVININNDNLMREKLMHLIASDPTFIVCGLQNQRDYTGQRRPSFMGKCWGKSALKVFFGITDRELDYMVSAQRKDVIIQHIDEVIQDHSEE